MTDIALSADMPDADLAKAIAKALRAGAPLALRGDGGGGLHASSTGWVMALAKARRPVSVHLTGTLAERGVALALLADAAEWTQAQAQDGAHQTPMIAVIAAQCLGQTAARRFLTDPDPAAALAACGLAQPPLPSVFTALKPALVAAAELPLDEAADFAALGAASTERQA
ncbi:hypothetical protein [Anianabacter salinae]|uniref:hypothetical protein n=1 Tax=Anianabacter salinae TaxID=2851023 RepID=UPI00225E1C8E|nr:hypothetical protein [Anianabacter salinae]MBV0911847.1 hypothetical protein [Anianabacter salinae]